MYKHAFLDFIHADVLNAERALISAYTEKNRLLYIECPKIEHAYMLIVGEFEQVVIKKEIENELLDKKKEMIQAAISRRESVDEDAIDLEINELKEQMLKESEGKASSSFVDLSYDEESELNEIYKYIVSNFHPQVHPERSKVYKDLYDKANEAYKCKDLDTMKLIYSLIKKAVDDQMAELINVLGEMGAEATEDDDLKDRHMTNYQLSESIYQFFEPSSDEIVLLGEYNRYIEKTKEVYEEIETITKTFPYAAKDMLSDKNMLDEYNTELENRLKAAEADIKYKEMEIAEMIERVNGDGQI